MDSAVVFGARVRTRRGRTGRRLETSDPRLPATLALGAFAVALLAGCGGDTPSTPASPPAAPEPPGVTAVTFLTVPFDSIGWVLGETIRIQVLFSEPVSVSGSPRLVLDVGSETRFAPFDEAGSTGAFVVFQYEVTREDRDEDGVSVGADALELNGGTIRNGAGLDANLDLGSHVIENSPPQVVVGAPPQQECTDERERALRFSRFVGEWDGTAFRVDMMRNFPDFVTDADLLELLAPMGRLADQIEYQLGYPVLEMGGLIEVPAGTPPGWNEDWEAYRPTDPLPRERGQLVAFYLDDYHPNEWDGTGLGAPMNGHTCCGSVSYNKRFLGPLWTGDDPCCKTGQNSRQGETIVHEVFHVLGYVHSDAYDRLNQDEGVAMSDSALTKPWKSGSPVYYAAWTDIDLLRCIFPEGG